MIRELKWDQKVGEWGFRVSFWCQLIWSIPLLILMIFKVHGNPLFVTIPIHTHTHTVCIHKRARRERETPSFLVYLFVAKGILMFTQTAIELMETGEGTFWEHLIFASLFAFMLKDCFLFYDTIDIMFTAHHFAVMLFMYCLYFNHTIAGM
jgi:hypothetical protein